MGAAIFALGTAVPPHIYSQEEIAHQSIVILSADQEKSKMVKRIYQNSAIRKRHLVISDFHKPKEEWDFLGSQYPKTVPGMSSRNMRYKEEAPKLAKEAAKQALERWGGDASRITHIISVSCTGVIAPGIEFYLMQDLGLSSKINRLGVNFMGCFGAFKGLSVARAFTLENPDHRILVVCTELCSLHLQADHDSETITANALFADGSAAAIVGGHPQPGEVPLWDITRTHSLGFNNSIDKMSWEASDRGYLMRLSRTVPVLIGRQIKEFIGDLLRQDISLEQCDWAIHPGGKSIIQSVERALRLKPDQTKCTWETFANYGNMSSATFLFVLDHLSRQAALRPWSVGIGFGPGLSVEGILLRSHLN
jgi:prepilin-type processing-associated H-X9-DG protein